MGKRIMLEATGSPRCGASDAMKTIGMSQESYREEWRPRKCQDERGDNMIVAETSTNHTSVDESKFVRRSMRDPRSGMLERRDVKVLLEKIRTDHQDTVVLKIKDHISSDITSAVMNEILAALHQNTVCQALYVQNLDKAIGDSQLDTLMQLLRVRQIWCLNIGETYHVSHKSWNIFCRTLPSTSVTHLYVSEHVIDLELKNQMRTHIRENRKKHDLHCSLQNIRVIERCTNMWWNPINAIRHQLDAVICPRGAVATRKLDPALLTPSHTAYWAEGVGKGGEKPWKFSCICGEVCSSYENYRYHPIGRMYECTQCSIWSHVTCVLGNISDDDLDELEDVLCSGCRSRARRQKLQMLRDLGFVRNTDRIASCIETTAISHVATDISSAYDKEAKANIRRSIEVTSKGPTESKHDASDSQDVEVQNLLRGAKRKFDFLEMGGIG